MAETPAISESPWFRPAFIGSAVVVVAILLLGMYVVLRPAPQPSLPTESHSASTSAPLSAGDCPPTNGSFSAGDALTSAPQTTWQSTKYSSLPSVAGVGPAVVEADGFRRCFAHSLTGASVAAATYVGQMADPALWEKTLRQSAIPAADMESQIHQMRKAGVNKAGDKVQVVGLTQVVATSERSVTVGLVIVIGDQTGASTLALEWSGTDWRVNPRTETSGLIDDYMVWGS